LKLGYYKDWLLLAHPHFEDQYSMWLKAAKTLEKKYPETYLSSDKIKRLGSLDRLVFHLIPQDPTDARYLLGNTLGKANRAWRRAKFGSQYRVFFRFDSGAKIIMFGWVNNSNTLRAYGSRFDAYLVFASMLGAGNPPANWDSLLEQSIE
jgi:toxin YhaV